MRNVKAITFNNKFSFNPHHTQRHAMQELREFLSRIVMALVSYLLSGMRKRRNVV